LKEMYKLSICSRWGHLNLESVFISS